MRSILSRFGELKPFKFGLVEGYEANVATPIPDGKHRKNGTCFTPVLVVGKYKGHPFDGTDRLSMAVQPDFLKMLKTGYAQEHSVLFEGDRLFTFSLLQSIADLFPDRWHIRAYVLCADAQILANRHISRGDSQTPKFIGSRKTKIARIRERFPTTALQNNTDEDLKSNAELITNEVIDRCLRNAAQV